MNPTRQEGKELQLNAYDRTRTTQIKKNKRLRIEASMKHIVPNISCDICHDVVTNSVMTKKCGHRFCDQCILLCLMRAGSTCPACRSNLNSKRELKQDPRFDTIISKLLRHRSQLYLFLRKKRLCVRPRQRVYDCYLDMIKDHADYVDCSSQMPDPSNLVEEDYDSDDEESDSSDLSESVNEEDDEDEMEDDEENEEEDEEEDEENEDEEDEEDEANNEVSSNKRNEKSPSVEEEDETEDEEDEDDDEGKEKAKIHKQKNSPIKPRVTRSIARKEGRRVNVEVIEDEDEDGDEADEEMEKEREVESVDAKRNTKLDEVKPRPIREKSKSIDSGNEKDEASEIDEMECEDEEQDEVENEEQESEEDEDEEDEEEENEDEDDEDDEEYTGTEEEKRAYYLQRLERQQFDLERFILPGFRSGAITDDRFKNFMEEYLEYIDILKYGEGKIISDAEDSENEEVGKETDSEDEKEGDNENDARKKKGENVDQNKGMDPKNPQEGEEKSGGSNKELLADDISDEEVDDEEDADNNEDIDFHRYLNYQAVPRFDLCELFSLQKIGRHNEFDYDPEVMAEFEQYPRHVENDSENDSDEEKIDDKEESNCVVPIDVDEEDKNGQEQEIAGDVKDQSEENNEEDDADAKDQKNDRFEEYHYETEEELDLEDIVSTEEDGEESNSEMKDVPTSNSQDPKASNERELLKAVSGSERILEENKERSNEESSNIENLPDEEETENVSSEDDNDMNGCNSDSENREENIESEIDTIVIPTLKESAVERIKNNMEIRRQSFYEEEEDYEDEEYEDEEYLDEEEAEEEEEEQEKVKDQEDELDETEKNNVVDNVEVEEAEEKDEEEASDGAFEGENDEENDEESAVEDEDDDDSVGYLDEILQKRTFFRSKRQNYRGEYLVENFFEAEKRNNQYREEENIADILDSVSFSRVEVLNGLNGDDVWDVKLTVAHLMYKIEGIEKLERIRRGLGIPDFYNENFDGTDKIVDGNDMSSDFSELVSDEAEFVVLEYLWEQEEKKRRRKEKLQALNNAIVLSSQPNVVTVKQEVIDPSYYEIMGMVNIKMDSNLNSVKTNVHLDENECLVSNELIQMRRQEQSPTVHDSSKKTVFEEMNTESENVDKKSSHDEKANNEDESDLDSEEDDVTVEDSDEEGLEEDDDEEGEDSEEDDSDAEGAKAETGSKRKQKTDKSDVDDEEEKEIEEGANESSSLSEISESIHSGEAVESNESFSSSEKLEANLEDFNEDEEEKKLAKLLLHRDICAYFKAIIENGTSRNEILYLLNRDYNTLALKEIAQRGENPVIQSDILEHSPKPARRDEGDGRLSPETIMGNEEEAEIDVFLKDANIFCPEKKLREWTTIMKENWKDVAEKERKMQKKDQEKFEKEKAEEEKKHMMDQISKLMIPGMVLPGTELGSIKVANSSNDREPSISPVTLDIVKSIIDAATYQVAKQIDECSSTEINTGHPSNNLRNAQTDNAAEIVPNFVGTSEADGSKSDVEKEVVRNMDNSTRPFPILVKPTPLHPNSVAIGEAKDPSKQILTVSSNSKDADKESDQLINDKENVGIAREKKINEKDEDQIENNDEEDDDEESDEDFYYSDRDSEDEYFSPITYSSDSCDDDDEELKLDTEELPSLPKIPDSLMQRYKCMKLEKEKKKYRDKQWGEKLSTLRHRRQVKKRPVFVEPHLPAKIMAGTPSNAGRPKKILKNQNVQMAIVQPPLPLHQLQFQMNPPTKITAVPNFAVYNHHSNPHHNPYPSPHLANPSQPSAQILQQYQMKPQQLLLRQYPPEQHDQILLQLQAQAHAAAASAIVASSNPLQPQMQNPIARSPSVYPGMPRPTGLEMHPSIPFNNVIGQSPPQHLSHPHMFHPNQNPNFVQQQMFHHPFAGGFQQIPQPYLTGMPPYGYGQTPPHLMPGAVPWQQQINNSFKMPQMPMMNPPMTPGMPSPLPTIVPQPTIHPPSIATPAFQATVSNSTPQGHVIAATPKPLPQATPQKVPPPQPMFTIPPHSITQNPKINSEKKILLEFPLERSQSVAGRQMETNKLNENQAEVELELWPTNGFRMKRRAAGVPAEAVFCGVGGNATFFHVSRLLLSRFSGQMAQDIGAFWVFRKEDRQLKKFALANTLNDAQAFVGTQHLIIFYDEICKHTETGFDYIVNPEYVECEKSTNSL
ncbi:unnamed protein product [Caenorhabditis bovis]|uniref:RING-type E3 ubiquitin transferase n=1 Tax=Caenorhabditis bovis TaxID=2654633 RepID=A0A8S1ESS8_9PELO|nr:unnamed protein product [Caenorhabditis bovis]